MVNPIHLDLSVHIVQDADEAIAEGYDWAMADPPVKPVEVKKLVVVRNGTEMGLPTVDFLMEDDSGQRYVFMVTGALLKSIPC